MHPHCNHDRNSADKTYRWQSYDQERMMTKYACQFCNKIIYVDPANREHDVEGDPV